MVQHDVRIEWSISLQELNPNVLSDVFIVSETKVICQSDVDVATSVGLIQSFHFDRPSVAFVSSFSPRHETKHEQERDTPSL